ncbi:hypothetical protein QVD17_27751 [Tagetes erecta]|uniref:Pectinesterase inhibitor domain-containing protein n=1 Tax=Tagetes erecta TaxID=13708 RepID=A0AAD8NS17_TARER|nr:hypothetical protein QVD17_27751 [Tagetes erecta]
MALAKHILSLISIFAVLLSTQCPTATSARAQAPAPSDTSIEVDSSPTPTPILSSESASDSPESATDSPLSASELFELSLPEIGVQKATITLQTEGAKVANKKLEGIEHRIDEFKGLLTKRQAEPGSESSKKCLTQCQENLEEAIDGVKISIESLNNQDFMKANVDISGIATDIETCNDCFIELDAEDKDIKGFRDWIQAVTKECLNDIKKT